MVVQLDHLLTVAEVAPLVQRSVKFIQSQLKRERFPIRHVDRVGREEYRFTVKDVQAYVERGEITNARLREGLPSVRHFFKRARKAG